MAGELASLFAGSPEDGPDDALPGGKEPVSPDLTPSALANIRPAFSGTDDAVRFTWRGFHGQPAGVVQDTGNTLHILCNVREQMGLPLLEPFSLLTDSLREPPAARPAWDRYCQENLFRIR